MTENLLKNKNHIKIAAYFKIRGCYIQNKHRQNLQSNGFTLIKTKAKVCVANAYQFIKFTHIRRENRKIMPKFSVKKPMTIFVVVVIIIALGIVSVFGMTPDLLPSMDLPYVVVMTTYPGATPEEIERTVTQPLEQGLATTENLKNIQSVFPCNIGI